MSSHGSVFNQRVWLNAPDSPSTGSVCTYCGPGHFDPDQKSVFIEIADCHQSARLHKTKYETKQDFINKLLLLESTVKAFREYVEGLDADLNDVE